jgi:hypothetical protein
MRNPILPDFPREYQGFGLVRLLTFGYLLVVLIRSCIHLFTEDGGAQSIAGVDTSGPGGNNVIAIFHQWGAIQLLLGLFLVLIFIRYKGFTPLVILVLSLDAPMRALAGIMGKLETSHTPPGAALNWPIFAFMVLLFIASLFKKKTTN